MRQFRTAHLVLAVVVIYSVARLADPHQRWAAIPVGGDRVEHAVVIYLIIVAALNAFPRLAPWAPAAALVGLGVLIEALQAHPSIVGAAQAGDVVANALGAVAATLPIWLERRRTAKP